MTWGRGDELKACNHFLFPWGVLVNFIPLHHEFFTKAGIFIWLLIIDLSQLKSKTLFLVLPAKNFRVTEKNNNKLQI